MQKRITIKISPEHIQAAIDELPHWTTNEVTLCCPMHQALREHMPHQTFRVVKDYAFSLVYNWWYSFNPGLPYELYDFSSWSVALKRAQSGHIYKFVLTKSYRRERSNSGL